MSVSKSLKYIFNKNLIEYTNPVYTIDDDLIDEILDVLKLKKILIKGIFFNSDIQNRQSFKIKNGANMGKEFIIEWEVLNFKTKTIEEFSDGNVTYKLIDDCLIRIVPGILIDISTINKKLIDDDMITKLNLELSL